MACATVWHERASLKSSLPLGSLQPKILDTLARNFGQSSAALKVRRSMYDMIGYSLQLNDWICVQTKVDEKLATTDATNIPIWATFCGVTNGVWKGKSAAFFVGTGSPSPSGSLSCRIVAS